MKISELKKGDFFKLSDFVGLYGFAILHILN